jgi:beta-lactamase regulating signal transducer with metallopeptidase domain
MNATSWLDRLDAIAPVFAEAAIRGAVVLLIALAASHLLRRRSAAARHLVWVGAVSVQLALPLFAIWGPRWNVAVPRELASVLPEPRVASTEPAATVRGTVGAPPVGTSSQATRSTSPTAGPSVAASESVSRAESARRIGGRPLLALLWAAGALFILVRLAVGTTLVAALARRGARVEDGGWLSLAQRLSASLQIDRPLTLLRGNRVGVPITWGIVYPVVLLPDDADAWPEERRRFVLVHEMAHVKRLDALTQLAGQLALAFFWFNPLVWIANRRMQLEREHACDDYVLRHGTSATHYAEELLAMVRSLGTPEHRTAQPAFAALAMARRSEFEGRMLSILDPVLDRHPLSKGRTLMSALAALLLVVPLAALHPYDRAAVIPDGLPAHAPPMTPSLPASRDTALAESFRISLRPVGEAAAPARQGAASVPSTPSLPSSPSLPSAVSLPSTPGRPSRVASPASPVSPVSPATPASTKATTSPRTCSDRAVPGTTINAIHSNDDDEGNSSFRYMSLRENGDCTEATLVGKVIFTDAEDDVASMPVTAHAVFRERTREMDRELVVRRADDGAVAHILRVNGQPAPYDDAARRWLAGYLPGVLREGAINVRPRVVRTRAQGGVDAVLKMIGTIQSSGAKRAHYDALLDDGRLSADDLDKLVRHAGRNLPSSGDLREVLTRAGPGARNGSRTSSAFEEAVNAVASSGDRRAVLQVYGQSTDRSMLLSVMKMAETVPSSGDRSSLLSVLAPNYLDRNDDALREAFFRTLATVPSSGDMRSVLSGATMGFAASNEKIAHAVAVAAADVPSSGDRATVLVQLAEAGALRSARVREAYMRAARGLASGDAVRVLQAAAVTRY